LNSQNNQIKFFRRRQFLLGPEYAGFDGWNRIQLDSLHLITVHPDLKFSVSEKGENKAVLLGYFLDPFEPEYSDEDILVQFLEEPITIDSVIKKLERLCGRFVLIISSRDNLWLFPDACALRQVNYCFDQEGNIWCASQPNLLAELLGFKYDKEMISFRNLPLFVSGQEDFWFPGDLTPYKEIKYLLPNHYLELTDGKVHRFWPLKGSFSNISMNECIDHVSSLLKNTIKAATLRFDLKMGITAGCDTRKSLAATKEVKDKITYYTHTPVKGGEADIEIPSRLLPRLGLKHYLVNLQPMDDDFTRYFNTNNTWPNERHGKIAYSISRYFGTDSVILNSNISEYSGVWYWLPKSKINGKTLAVPRALNHEMIISKLDDWLNEARPYCQEAKMNILVLFDLELRSRWVSQSLAQYDLGFETFNPYNNRYLFQLELSVDEKLREGRSSYMPRKLIRKMWPEVLSEPINPEKGIINKLINFINQQHFLFPVVRLLRFYKHKRMFKSNQPQQIYPENISGSADG
jgi:hypothetical protein